MSHCPPTLLRNGTVVTCLADQQQPVHFVADVLIQNGVISSISRKGERPATVPYGCRIIDATNKLICPGFVDTHRHVWEAAYKWMGDWTLMEYVAKCVMLLPPLIQKDDAYASQLLGCLEALNAGVTSVVDHCHLTTSPGVVDSMLEATRKSGIRSFFCYTRWDEFPSGSNRKAWQMQQLKDLATNGTGSDRITLGIGIDGTTEAFFTEMRDDIWPFLHEHDIDIISTHFVGSLSGIGPDAVNQFSTRGLLDRPILFVHANSLSKADCELINSSKSGISSNPEIELAMSHGDPVAMFADSQGVRVGLGVDCSSVVGSDMFSVMRFALQHQRGADHSKLAKDGKIALQLKHNTGDVFRLATIGGARAIRRENIIGSIEVGKMADILLVDTLTPSMLGAEVDPVQAIVLHATPSDISTVFVDGEIVVDKNQDPSSGVFSRVNWNDVVCRTRESTKHIRGQLENWKESENAKYAEWHKMVGFNAVPADQF
ncbi:hypothetical protein FRB96_005667 [Tulasnella sp. 330]|nr:hypothetical protein FRB96_005667 [Tulasnella sp. 330]KAG8877334.1 hypothetical protein FRB97_003522 [Tulasnella sp. 331]